MKYTTRLFSLAIAAAVCLSATLANAATITEYTFENVVITGSPGTDNGPYSATTGTGSVTGHHATAATAWSTPSGNGTTQSFSSNNWSVDDYYQLTSDTTGQSGIQLDWEQTGSNTGPRDFVLQYSTTGVAGPFTQFGSQYSLIVSTWTPGTYSTGFHQTFDLSSITALDNNPNAVFRIVDSSTNSINGGTVATAGTGRIDTFTVSTVPEPSTLVLCGLGLIGLVGVSRRRKA